MHVPVAGIDGEGNRGGGAMVVVTGHWVALFLGSKGV